MEDLNYLLYCEQAELLLALNAPSSARKFAHMDLARGYSVRISSHQLPYRTRSESGKIGFNPGRFGASPKPTAKLFKRAGGRIAR
jgi:hypothetical protein